MKRTIQKSTIFYLLLVLVLPSMVHTSGLIHQPYQENYSVLQRQRSLCLIRGYCRVYQVPLSLCSLIKKLLGNPWKYTNKNLPEDLAGQDLRGFDFTGCQFNGTNLTDTNLQNVILANTTCNYLEKFKKNMKEKERSECLSLCASYISSSLQDISKRYKLIVEEDHHSKAKLLHIASGLAQLPFYENKELNIKCQYWFVQLKLLKSRCKPQDNSQQYIVLELETQLEEAIEYCSWKTSYPQDKIDLSEENANANFKQYLLDFNNGCNNYLQNASINPLGVFFVFYKKHYVESIQASIEKLEKVYPNIKRQELQQEACKIGKALSKSYQIEEIAFINHYLVCQNRLIFLQKRLKKQENLNNPKLYYCGMQTNDITWSTQSL